MFVRAGCNTTGLFYLQLFGAAGKISLTYESAGKRGAGADDPPSPIGFGEARRFFSMNMRENVRLASFTTIRLGGEARYFVEVKSVDDLREALRWADEKSVSVHILGGGSNTIFSDKGFDGLVVKMGLMGISWEADGQVSVMAGEDWDGLVEESVRKDLAGFECLSGIPGLAGATPMQNVGAYGQEVAQTIVRVKALDRETLEEKIFDNSDCGFVYRGSRFKYEDLGKYVIYEVVYMLDPGGKPTLDYPQVAELFPSGEASLADVREGVLRLRRNKSMVVSSDDLNSRSCGSFFVNPVTGADIPGAPTFVDSDSGEMRIPAAWLIEQAGFPKGFSRNGVGISENHNLALVNRGGTTKDLLELAEEIASKVNEKFGVELAREPVVVD